MIALALPVIVACLAAGAVLALARVGRPEVSVVALTTTVAATAVAATALVALLALVLLFDPHGTAWCERFLGHGEHRALLPGLVAAGGVALVVGRACRAAVRRRSVLVAALRRDEAGIEVLATAEPVAYARPGRVVVSQGMLDALSGEERLVLYAHERAHLRHRHHWYIAVAEVSAAAIPGLSPLAERVRFACERWADEEAAAVVGERRLAARAVAVAALAGADGAGLAFGGGGQAGAVPARVEALLRPAVERRAPVVALVALPGVVALGAAVLQALRLHEVVALLV